MLTLTCSGEKVKLGFVVKQQNIAQFRAKSDIFDTNIKLYNAYLFARDRGLFSI